MGQLSAQLCLRQGHHNLGGMEMNVVFLEHKFKGPKCI